MKVRISLQQLWSVARQTGWLKLVDGHSMNKHKERTVWILALYRWNLHLQFKNNWPPEQKNLWPNILKKNLWQSILKKSLTEHSEKHISAQNFLQNKHISFFCHENRNNTSDRVNKGIIPTGIEEKPDNEKWWLKWLNVCQGFQQGQLLFCW